MKTTLTLLLASLLFLTGIQFAHANQKFSTRTEMRMLPPGGPNAQYISGTVFCDVNGHICVMTLQGARYKVANGNGLMQSGQIAIGMEVTGRLVGGGAGVGEVTIIII